MSDLIKITTNEEGKQLVSARELHEFLEIGKVFGAWINDMIGYGFEENVDYTTYWSDSPKNGNTVEYLGSPQKMSARGYTKEYIITIDMAKDICRKQRRNKKSLFMIKYLSTFDNRDVYIIEPDRKEVTFINKLETALIPFKLKGIKQFRILNYRIDYYISNLNIAIEYDENGHKNYSHEAQEGRQKKIEKELGCRFIRVSDKNSDEYNIGLVIKEIFNI